MSKNLKKIAQVALPIAGFAVGGPVGAGIGGALGGAINGGGVKGALTGGAMGYGGGSLFGGLTGLGGAASGSGGALGGLFGSSGSGGGGLLSGLLGGGESGGGILSSLFGGGSSTAPWGTALSSTGLNLGGASSGGGGLLGGLLGGGSGGGLFGGSLSSFSPLLGGLLGTSSNDKTQKALLAQQEANRQLYQPLLDNSLLNGGLENDAGYKFARDQGEQALGRKQSASGNYFSGEALTDAEKFGTGLADSTYNDAFKRYLSTAGAIQGINDNVGNIQAGALTNNNNLLSGVGASLLGGSGLSNSGDILGNVGNNVLTIAGQRYLRDNNGQLIQIG